MNIFLVYFLSVICLIILVLVQNKKNYLNRLILPIILAIFISLTTSVLKISFEQKGEFIDIISIPGNLYLLTMKSIIVPLLFVTLLYTLLKHSSASKKILSIIGSSVLLTGVCSLITLLVTKGLLSLIQNRISPLTDPTSAQLIERR